MGGAQVRWEELEPGDLLECKQGARSFLILWKDDDGLLSYACLQDTVSYNPWKDFEESNPPDEMYELTKMRSG